MSKSKRNVWKLRLPCILVKPQSCKIIIQKVILQINMMIDDVVLSRTKRGHIKS